MRPWSAWWVLVSCFVTVACGGDEGDSTSGGKPPADTDCGGVECASAGYCDRSVTPPVCRCNEGYEGDQCDFCAAGYLLAPDGTCKMVLIDCELDPKLCGDHGMCVDGEADSDHCACDTGYDGVLCERCAEGYQGHAGDGTCAEGCDLSGLQCNPPLVCRDDTGVPRCDCPEGMVGESCDLCATGYHDPMETGQCTPTCATAALVCPEGRRCDDSLGDPVCACPLGFGGEDCTACAPGYQDHAVAGNCRPGCEAAGEDCSGHGACSDDTGWLVCACAQGWAGHHCEQCDLGYQGENCDDCASHYYRVGDGPCMPDCQGAGALCGSRGECVEEEASLRCVCAPGFGGATCETCLSGYSPDANGQCVSAPRAEHTLLAMGFHGTDSYYAKPWLIGIDPVAGTFEGLRPLTVKGDIAADRDTGTLYVGKDQISHVDVTTGEATTLPATLGDRTFGLSWDPSRDLLWTWRVDDRHIVGVSPSTGVAQDTVVNGPVAGGYHHAYRAATDTLYLYHPSNAPGNVKLSTAVATAFDYQIPPLEAEYSYALGDSGVGIAFAGGTDRLYIAGRKALDDEQKVAATCAEAARWLGLGDYADAPHLQHHQGPIQGEVVLDAGGTGPGLVTYHCPDEVNTGSPVLTVATTNPDAVVCIGVNREPLLLRIAANTKCKAIIVDMRNLANVRLEVDAGLAQPSKPLAHMLVADAANADPSLFGSPAFLRVYDVWDWSQRNMPSLVYPTGQGQGVLLEVNPDTGVLVSERKLEGYFPVYDMTGW
jgi:hypothetical protein